MVVPSKQAPQNRLTKRQALRLLTGGHDTR